MVPVTIIRYVGMMGGMRCWGGRRRRGSEGNGKEDSRGKPKEQGPTYIKKTDEKTRRTTKKDLQDRRRANARGQQFTEREFPPLATARGGRTSSEKANESNPTRWQQEARRQKKEGRLQNEEGAKSQDEEGKGSTEGEEEEGAGGHVTKERRKANEEPAEGTGVVQEEGGRTAETPNRRKARSRVKTRCRDDKKTRDHGMEGNRRSLLEREERVYKVQIYKDEIMNDAITVHQLYICQSKATSERRH